MDELNEMLIEIIRRQHELETEGYQERDMRPSVSDLVEKYHKKLRYWLGG